MAGVWRKSGISDTQFSRDAIQTSDDVTGDPNDSALPAETRQYSLMKRVIMSDRSVLFCFFLVRCVNPGILQCCTNPDPERLVAKRAGIDMPIKDNRVFSELYQMDEDGQDREVLMGAEERRVASRMYSGLLCISRHPYQA